MAPGRVYGALCSISEPFSALYLCCRSKHPRNDGYIRADRHEAEQLREIESDWLAQMSGAKLNACCCGVKGCLDFRRRYRDGVSTLTLTIKSLLVSAKSTASS